VARIRTPRGAMPEISYPKLYFDMEPDEEEVRHDILLLRKKMGDYNLPLQYSKQIIIGDVKKAFLAEKDPRGPKWPALSARAAKVPRFGKLRRMQTNARMYRALINRYNWGVTNEGVYLNVARLPRNEDGQIYFPLHQQDDSTGGASGSGILKVNREKLLGDIAGRLVELQKTRRYEGQPDRIERLKQDAAYDVQKRYTKEAEDRKEELGLAEEGGGKIPRRRMVGPSVEAEKKIEDVFDAWAKDVITIYKRGGRGGVVVMAPRRGLK
jgi:hypothetical protein